MAVCFEDEFCQKGYHFSKDPLRPCEERWLLNDSISAFRVLISTDPNKHSIYIIYIHRYLPTLGWLGSQCRHTWHTWSVWARYTYETMRETFWALSLGPTFQTQFAKCHAMFAQCVLMCRQYLLRNHIRGEEQLAIPSLCTYVY